MSAAQRGPAPPADVYVPEVEATVRMGVEGFLRERGYDPRCGEAVAGAPPMPGCDAAGCDHADMLSAASSVISMPIITHWTRRAVDAVAAIATVLLISLLLRPTAGRWQ